MSGGGTIDFDEFLAACLRLQGPARALDLILLTRDSRRFFEQQLAMLQSLQLAPPPGAGGLPPAAYRCCDDQNDGCGAARCDFENVAACVTTGVSTLTASRSSAASTAEEVAPTPPIRVLNTPIEEKDDRWEHLSSSGSLP